MNTDRKTAIVTGGSRGIGHAIAEVLALRGANIYANINLDLAQKTAIEISSSSGQKVIGLPVNVASLESCGEMVDKTITRIFKIDILVNNAGVTRDNLIMRMDEQDFEFVIDINLKDVWELFKGCNADHDVSNHETNREYLICIRVSWTGWADKLLCIESWCYRTDKSLS